MYRDDGSWVLGLITLSQAWVSSLINWVFKLTIIWAVIKLTNWLIGG